VLGSGIDRSFSISHSSRPLRGNVIAQKQLEVATQGAQLRGNYALRVGARGRTPREAGGPGNCRKLLGNCRKLPETTCFPQWLSPSDQPLATGALIRTVRRGATTDSTQGLARDAWTLAAARAWVCRRPGHG
jgi:hypothetical protein